MTIMPRVKRYGWTILLAIQLAAAFSWARVAAFDTKADPAKTAAITEPVSVDLIVRDKRGREVRDLRPSDVEIDDDGKPVQIKSLQLKTPAGSAGTERQEREASAQIHLVTLVFDESNPSADAVASDIVSETLKQVGPANAYFSVWQIQSRVGMAHDFTNDEQALKQAIMPAPAAGAKSGNEARGHGQAGAGPPAKQAPASGGGSSRKGSPDEAGELRRKLTAAEAKILSDSEQMIREQHLKPSVAGLLAIARDEKPLSGRKIILYFSNGLQISTASADQMEAIIGSANRSEVSIYTVNAGGIRQKALDEAQRMVMMTQGWGGGFAKGSFSGGTLGMNDSAAQRMSDMKTANGSDSSLEQQRTRYREASRMSDLATKTAGVYLEAASSSAVAKSVRQISEDLTTYYEASYIPSKLEFDGRFREVDVKIDRPHVKVQSRSGYFSLPPYEGDDLAPFELSMMRALAVGEKVETFWFDGDVLRMPSREAPGRANLIVQIPLSGLVAREDDNTKLFRLHFAVLALVKDRDGRTVDKLSQDLALQGALEQLGLARKDVYTFSRPFHVDEPGDYHVDIAVSDQNAAKLSAKTVAFSMPQHEGGLGLSDLLVVRRVEHESSTAPVDDGLRYKDSRIIPDLNSREARVADPAHPVFFEVFPDGKSVTLPQVELELMQGESVVAKQQVAIAEAKPGEPIPVLASFAAKGLSAGTYKLRATVTQSASSHEEQVSFELSGAAAESAQAYLKQDEEPESASFERFTKKPTLIPNAARPGDEQIRSILDGAKERALDYKNQLPNFLCMEATDRFVDPSGKGAWKANDSYTMLLRYVNGEENTVVIDIAGQRPRPDQDTHFNGATVKGEFGELLGMILGDKAKSKIEWLGAADIGGTRTQVFRYTVERSHSDYQLIAGEAGTGAIVAAYQALVYVDANTFGVRRLEIEAQDVPKNFPVRESAITVDYDYVPISGHDFLLPLRASLFIRQGPHHLRRNEIQFQGYRKYGAESTLKSKR